ncbi:MAG: 5-methyltetrahydropteroyltriglutamate--homocysteine methyltransferase [Planctomycetes bacterium]|nr:5-methyltetrahydropteroyltriglutamate--homocysteine methyltransferase [Planctomycetota bacterium]
MNESGRPYVPDARFDGGDLDCGNGLLLLIRRHIDPLRRGQLLEIRSTEVSVEEELPAWCRLTGNELVSFTKNGNVRSFLVCKGMLAERTVGAVAAAAEVRAPRAAVESGNLISQLATPAAASAIAPLSVVGIGSWPRPRWLVRAIHERIESKLSDEEFQQAGDDAVRLAVAAQLRAGAHVLTDGEQRRDSYANFVGARLDGCQLIPLTDLLALVDDPDALAEELRSLDVPAAEVRHPAIFGKIRRTRPIAAHELRFLTTLTNKPLKVAIPGPYLLSRILWIDCIPEKVYQTREDLADDIVRVLREELFELLSLGASIVQFDEPVLTEVVFGEAKNRRSFMCGALSEKGRPDEELAFARELIHRVVEGAPRERTAVHVCRGNWTPDERAALTGDYRPLVELLRSLRVGTLFLELCTPRAGEIDALDNMPPETRIGVGVVNPKDPRVESADEIVERAKRAIDRFGRDRVLLNPDCGFATFADNPVASAEIAEAKMRAMSEASERLG